MRPLQCLLESNLLVPQNDSLEHSRLEEIDSTDFFHKERWQSGRMRVFAKDVTGQKLVHGFESRPLRFLICNISRISCKTWHFQWKTKGTLAPFVSGFVQCFFGVHCDTFPKSKTRTSSSRKISILQNFFHEDCVRRILRTILIRRLQIENIFSKFLACRAHNEWYISRR